MSSYYIPECQVVPPVCNPCIVTEEGRVRGAVFMTLDFYNTGPNFQLYSTWANAVKAGQMWWFPQCNGSMDMTPKLSDSYGSVPQQVDSFTFDFKLAFPNVQTNVATWNSLQNVNNLVFGYTSQTLFWLGSAPAMVVPTIPIPASITDKVDIKANIQFIQNFNIVPQPLITGLADTCID